jgi:murein tripeptide amidase MpaA
MSGPKTSAAISTHLDQAAAGSSGVCTRLSWAAGSAGASAGYVKIAAATAASPAQRWATLISGGVHARELAPPDALVSFVEKLLAAYAAHSAVVYPAWTSPVDSVTYSSFTIPWPQVQAVVERLDLYVAPLVNADGRDFVLAPLASAATHAEQQLHKMWRKNRRPAPAGQTGDSCIGVDLNRNCDILWDFTTAYTPALVAQAPKAGVDTSQQPCNFNVYSGPSAESEPETQNLAGLMRTASISFYADVHAYGRDILYPWGIETDQSTDPTQSFENRAKDGQRDGNQANAYAEYVPAGQLAALQAMAKRMCDFIYAKAGGADPTAQARSVYKPAESAVLYPTKVTTGAFDDYCFSRWFTQATAGTPIRPVMAFTIEAGGNPKLGAGNDEGGFAPDYVKHYPKIEREIHAALWGFLTAIAASGAQPPSAPPQPSPPAPEPPLEKDCFIAGAAYRDDAHPDVMFLRDVRDRQLRGSAPGRLFAVGLIAIYSRVGPAAAGWLGDRPRAVTAVRYGFLRPLIAALRRVSRCTEGRPRARSVLLALTLGIALAAPVAGLAVTAVAMAPAATVTVLGAVSLGAVSVTRRTARRRRDG